MATKASDNRYGRVKYNQTKYGASSASAVIAYGLEIDWDDDGLFGGDNEDDRLIAYSGFRGRKKMLSPTGGGWQSMDVGTYTFLLDDYDGRYTTYNTSSALYPNVTYGKDVRFRARDLNGGSTYDVFYGIIQDVIPVISEDRDRQVRIIVQDAWSYLRNNNANVPVYEAVAPETVIGYILDDVGWPARWGRDLDATSDSISYYWASGKNSAGLELERLAHSWGGQFFIAADGKATFKSRSNFPAATLALSESDLLKSVVPSQPWENSRNITKITSFPKTVASSGAIWTLSGTAPSIANGVTFKFTANYSYDGKPVGAKNVISPVSTTDWTTNTEAGGAGTDKTADCTFTIVDNGDNAFCSVTNNSGVTVYLQSGSKIRGYAIYTVDTVDNTYPSDPSTVTQPRTFFQELPWQQDLNVSASLVDVLGPFFATAFPIAKVDIQGRPDIQFTCDLWDVASLTMATMGIAGSSFRVAGISHATLRNCQDVKTTLYLEPYPVLEDAGVYDTGVYDTAVYGW